MNQPLRDKLGRILKLPGQLATDIATLAAHVVKSGQVAAPDQKIAERMATCAKCDKFNGRTCALCGCHMKYKVVLATSVCPIGKWN